jgi:hypothetical protein
MSSLKPKFLMGVFLAFALVAAPRDASAGSILFNGFGLGDFVNAKLLVNGTWHTEAVTAGELNWTWQGTPDTPSVGQSFYAYCVDFLGALPSPMAVTSIFSDGFTNGVVDGGAKAAWLINTFAADVHASGSNTKAAALQVAIWEAMYDAAPSYEAGNFVVGVMNSALDTQAEFYMAALNYAPGLYHTSTALILDATTVGGQDQIVAANEPATVFLVGLGLVLSTQIRRRRSSSQQRA